jgi:hypothetical protein
MMVGLKDSLDLVARIFPFLSIIDIANIPSLIDKCRMLFFAQH